MKKLSIILIVVFVLMLSVMPVSAQEAGDIIIQPEGLVYTIIGTLVGALAGAGALYYKLSGKKASEKLDEDSRNGMLGLLLVGGWLASLTPGQWDDQQLEKIMQANGFQKPTWDINTELQSQGLPFKGVPHNSTVDNNVWARDLTPLGDVFPGDEDVKG